METINYTEMYRSDRLVIAYSKGKDIIRNQWLMQDMPDEDMKFEMQQWMNVYEQVKASRIITDNTVGYVIVPEMQEWMAPFLFPKIINIAARRWAFIVGTEIFSAISVEQMATEIETNEHIYQQHFFETEDKGVAWILEQ